jgi:hypothetical protein
MTPALLTAALALVALSPPEAQAAPVTVIWRDCQGTLDWRTPCWTTEDGLPAGSPQAGQNAVLLAQRPVEVHYDEDGAQRPLARLQVDGVSTLRQRGGSLSAEQLVIGGWLAGHYVLDAGLASFQQIALGGDRDGPTSVYGVSLQALGGRLDGRSMTVGRSQRATLHVDGGRVVLSEALDLSSEGGGAEVTLREGRLEAQQIRASERRELTTLNLAGGTLAMAWGSVTVGRLNVGALGQAATLTLADEIGDNRLSRVLADQWVVGPSVGGEVEQLGGIATVGELRVGVGVTDDPRHQGRYTMHGGLLGGQSIAVGMFGGGSMLQTGGQVALQGDLTLGFGRDGRGRFELQGGQLLVDRLRGHEGQSRFEQTGGLLQARFVTGLDVLHLAGGQRDLVDVILSPHGLLALDDDRLSVSGLLTVGGTLALRGRTPEPEQWIDLLDWGTLVGTFATIDASAWQVPDGYRLDLSRLYLDGQVGLWKSVVTLPPVGGTLPAPASAALVLGALALLLRFRRAEAGAGGTRWMMHN